MSGSVLYLKKVQELKWVDQGNKKILKAFEASGLSQS